MMTCLCACIFTSCVKTPPVDGTDDSGFKEAVPVKTTFTNAEFIYHGDDIGEGFSDGWQIKLYTDMEIDEAGAPIGPGCVVQLLLNVRYDENQSADAAMLPGTYSEMVNSGNFAPGTFVNGYISYIDVPGGRLELADATFYADVEDGSTQMDYDLIDEGAVSISMNEDGTCSIEGVLVGKKFTKRYFSWKGEVNPKDNSPEIIPNSTLKSDIEDISFTQGLLQDKGDIFYLKDESYRCLLLYLGSDSADMSSFRPAGDGPVLRLEMLVPWETDIHSDGIPAGEYPMMARNADTSFDKENIVPGVSLEGLRDVFAAWEMAGCWYYELKDGEWTDTYARISSGVITVNRPEDGSHRISYDLQDCQQPAKKITGTTVISTIRTL